jgi:ferrochelatase
MPIETVAADPAAAETSGVLIVNLGTPDAPTPGAVRRYLRQFLSDPRVVRIPRLVWLPLLYLLVLPFRPARTARKYAAIWRPDGAPLRVYHLRQAQLLRGYLGQALKRPVAVAAGMRYGEPSIAAALKELESRGCVRLLVMPLYPQYAESTTESVRDAVARALARRKSWKPRVKVLEEFHADSAYVKAIAKNVNEYWMKHGRPDRLVMSFHGLPQAAPDAPGYERQCRESARLIATELGWNDARTVTTFQSRFGRAAWLQPYTAATLKELGGAGSGRVDVICPGFASDCLESLEEIALEGRDTFRKAGGKEFHYIPTTNDTPAWMSALARLALENL